VIKNIEEKDMSAICCAIDIVVPTFGEKKFRC
jgi:hypothetical protein